MEMLVVGPSPVTPVQVHGTGIVARPAYTDIRVSPQAGENAASGPAPAAGGGARPWPGGGGASGAGGPAAEAAGAPEPGSDRPPWGGFIVFY